MTEREVVRLCGMRPAPLEVAEVLAAVEHPAAGGVALFVGAVRDHDGGREVRELAYSAHPSAERVLREVAEKIAADGEVLALAVLHRVGDLAVGDPAVVAAVACAHRGPAFEACERLVDDVKHEVPIWKLQRYTDGDSGWVGIEE